MNLPEHYAKLNKKWIILGVIGFVLIFLTVSFLASYYEYKKSGPISEEPVSTYDEDSFARLHEEFIKDKPHGKDQKEILAEIVKESKKADPRVRRISTESLYSKGTFDTLAVNCGILLEKYKELVIKCNELEKQLGKKKGKTASGKKKGKSSASRFAAKPPATSRGFDYTRYIRTGTSSELRNEGGGGSFGKSAQFTWATLSLRQKQRVFNQSVVAFDVAEAFELQGSSIPRSAVVEGVAQVSRGRGRIFITFRNIYTEDQTFDIEGEVFALDRSRGLNVFIHGESSVAESFKREATDLIGLLDPSRTGIGRNVIQDTDVGQEVYGVLDAGTMVLANIRKR
ncbi:MAG: hypothetical protein ACE5IY_10350 [bacterium]